MKKLLRFNSHFIKRGKGFWLLPLFLFISSCSGDISHFGKVKPYSSVDKSLFVFLVDDEFLKSNPNSSPDKKNPKISKAEAKLLYSLLKKDSYCLNSYGSPNFIITSKQEKVYDVTYAHLIESNYNTRSIAPKMYYGKCEDVSK